MSQTTAHTFITAAILLVLSVTLYLYGHHVVESQMVAADGMFRLYDGFYAELDSWEKAAGWLGLVAVSVAIGGAIRWDRETRPIMERASILGLDERAPKQMAWMPAPLRSTVIAEPRIEDSNERCHQEENLTPLERVIRGY